MTMTLEPLKLFCYYDLDESIQQRLKGEFLSKMRVSDGIFRGMIDRHLDDLDLNVQYYQLDLTDANHLFLGVCGGYSYSSARKDKILDQLTKEEKAMIQAIKRTYKDSSDNNYLSVGIDFDLEKKELIFYNLAEWLTDSEDNYFFKNLLERCHFKAEERPLVIQAIRQYHRLQEAYLRGVFDGILQTIKGMMDELVEIWFYQTKDEEAGEVWYDKEGVIYDLDLLEEQKIPFELPETYRLSGVNWIQREKKIFNRLLVA